MQKEDRTENKILNRIELAFSWKHDKKSTPSRKEVIDAVHSLEPGSNRDLIVVKDCSTRFGQPLTTGLAYIYASAEAMAVEPKYINARHKALRSSSGAEEAKTEGGDE